MGQICAHRIVRGLCKKRFLFFLPTRESGTASNISIFSLLTILLSSCTTVTPIPPTPTLTWEERDNQLAQRTHWQLEGKVGVQTAHDTGSASILWTQYGDRYTMTLLGPLGTGELKLVGQPGTIRLDTPDGKHYVAANPEQLLATVWGFQWPVSHLSYWVRALPVPGIPSHRQFGTDHRLLQLSQAGWQVQYWNYTSEKGIALPTKMMITSSALKTKIIVYHWHIEHNTASLK